MFKNHSDAKKPYSISTPHLEQQIKSNQESLISLKVSSNPKFDSKKSNPLFHNSFRAKPKATDPNQLSQQKTLVDTEKRLSQNKTNAMIESKTAPHAHKDGLKGATPTSNTNSARLSGNRPQLKLLLAQQHSKAEDRSPQDGSGVNKLPSSQLSFSTSAKQTGASPRFTFSQLIGQSQTQNAVKTQKSNPNKSAQISIGSLLQQSLNFQKAQNDQKLGQSINGKQTASKLTPGSSSKPEKIVSKTQQSLKYSGNPQMERFSLNSTKKHQGGLKHNFAPNLNNVTTPVAQAPQKESQGDLDDIRMSPSTFKISSQGSADGNKEEMSPAGLHKKSLESENSPDSSEQLFLSSVEETSITPLFTMTANLSPSEKVLQKAIGYKNLSTYQKQDHTLIKKLPQIESIETKKLKQMARTQERRVEKMEIVSLSPKFQDKDILIEINEASSEEQTKYRSSIQQSCDIELTSQPECQAIEQNKFVQDELAQRNFQLAENDFDVMEVELDALEVEGPIQKAKTVRNMGTQFQNNNDFQKIVDEKVNEEGETPSAKSPTRVSQVLQEEPKSEFEPQQASPIPAAEPIQQRTSELKKSHVKAGDRQKQPLKSKQHIGLGQSQLSTAKQLQKLTQSQSKPIEISRNTASKRSALPLFQQQSSNFKKKKEASLFDNQFQIILSLTLSDLCLINF